MEHYYLIGANSELSNAIRETTWGKTLKTYVDKIDELGLLGGSDAFVVMLKHLFPNTTPFGGVNSHDNSFLSNKVNLKSPARGRDAFVNSLKTLPHNLADVIRDPPQDGAIAEENKTDVPLGALLRAAFRLPKLADETNQLGAKYNDAAG